MQFVYQVSLALRDLVNRYVSLWEGAIRKTIPHLY
jgi:hypothetical protein